MSTPDPTCLAVEEHVIAGMLGDSHREHVAACATCKGLLKMTGQIETELAEVPFQAGQVPQWIAAMHVGNTRRRKRILWGSAFAAVAATVAIVLFVPGITGRVTPSRAPDQRPTSAPAPTLAPPVQAPAAPKEATTARPPGLLDRPDWITTNQLFVSYCRRSEEPAELQCVGISAHRDSKEEAKAEASDAALEALLDAVADKIQSRVFVEQVRPAYDPQRRRMIQAYAAKEDAAKDEFVPLTDPDYRALAGARRRAAKALLATGSAAVPPIPSDWFWEQFLDIAAGTGMTFVAYVNYTVSDTQLAKLVEIYGAEATHNPGQMAVPFPLQAFATGK